MKADKRIAGDKPMGSAQPRGRKRKRNGT